MIKNIFISLLLAMFSSVARAGYDDWDNETKSLYVASNVLLLADWASTRHMVRQFPKGGYYENNIILGKYPSMTSVDLYFIGSMIANYYMVDNLSPKVGKWYLTGLIVLESSVVSRNLKIGLKINF
jgi:hypothetical protein